MVGTGLHGDTIKGTNIHTKLASRASDRINLGFWNLEGLDLFDSLALGINDGLNRAVDAADATVNAEIRINVKYGFLFTRNSFGGTFHRAEGASYAVIEDHVRQERTP